MRIFEIFTFFVNIIARVWYFSARYGKIKMKYIQNGTIKHEKDQYLRYPV